VCSSDLVSANLFDVTILEALDVLLRANDLRMEEAGNFIYVYTRVEWEEILRGRTKRESRNFPLEYLNAKDASEFIKPILSETGKVSFVGDVDKGFQPSEEDGGRDSWAFQGMIVVSDFPDNLKAIEALLKEIDSPPAQVVVESTVVSSKVQQDDGFGVDVSVIGSLDFNNLTNPMSGANDLFAGVNEGIQPADNRGYSGNSAVAGWDRASTMRVGVLAQDVAVFLRLLDSVTDTTVLARPRVMALNRQRAQILIGRRVGYLTSTTTQTSTTQTVEFLDSGIKLIFRPFISTDGSIRMELAPSVSDAKIETLTSADGATQSVPNEDTSEIVTNVRVKDGQTLVLGGLFKEDTKIERRQVPGLGDIPLLGNAFKGYDDQLKREEIIFLITPTIVKDQLASIWADEARLSDPAYCGQALAFVKASLKGWAYCRDNVEACRDIVVAKGSKLGNSHQLWQVNEVNKLIWPASNGVGYIDEAAWNRTAEIASGTKNLDGKTVLSKAPDATSWTNDIVSEAIKQLEAEGVDVKGAGYAPIEVTLEEGGA
jgi:type II secretory pathway component GspD/PulD (secretin)